MNLPTSDYTFQHDLDSGVWTLTVLRPGLVQAEVSNGGNIEVWIGGPGTVYPTQRGPGSERYMLGPGEGIFYYPDGSVAKAFIPMLVP